MGKIENANNDLKKADPPKENVTTKPSNDYLKADGTKDDKEKECFICKGKGHYGVKDSKVICPNAADFSEAVTKYY